MQPVRVLTGVSAQSETIRQLKRCRRAWIAVAWATENQVFEELVRNADKMQCVVIGTHGSLTAPNCIERLANKNWVVFRSPSGPLFHPKLYLFEHEDRYSAIVGSHNLTNGGFEHNEELSTISDFEKGENAAEVLRKYVEGAAEGKRIFPTSSFLSRYRASYRSAKRMRAFAEALIVDETDQATEDLRSHAPIHMEWVDWLRQVDESDEHGRRRRLEMLRSVREMLGRPGGFAHLPLLERQRVTGLSMEHAKGDAIDWNLFGDMTALRLYDKPFARLVASEPPTALAAALDILPERGVPSREDWLGYWNALIEATDGAGGIGLSGATRLAALKRPDFFVPVTDANRDRLSVLLGVPKRALKSPAEYWDFVIKTIVLTPWWASDRPSDGVDAETWDARAAMLDALVYEKTTHIGRKTKP